MRKGEGKRKKEEGSRKKQKGKRKKEREGKEDKEVVSKKGEGRIEKEGI